MIEFIIDVSINFITFTICFIPLLLSEKTKGILEIVCASILFAGIMIVGTGIFISSSETLKSYIYVILVVQIIILCIELILVLWSKRKGKSTILSILSAILGIVALGIYIYYVIASFIYRKLFSKDRKNLQKRIIIKEINTSLKKKMKTLNIH